MKQIIKRITALLCSAVVAFSCTVVSGAENVSEKPARTYPVNGLIQGECIYITPEEADLIDEHVRADYAKSPVINASDSPVFKTYNHSSDYFYKQLSASGKELYDNLDAVCKAFANSTVTVTPTGSGS